MVTLDTEQKPERQHCGRRMCAICRRIKRDKGNERHNFYLNATSRRASVWSVFSARVVGPVLSPQRCV
ncbi:hypothetical protein X777_16910 [Ooceraea biroi]|uniref:Uncharacterized protein n=1 Tax=Ooceraea biroi TaxID=2015173 RepID=A0A026WTG1_OOCBI|nr:hypothetical protein X777_16910 [Ooceraea biroi]